MDRKENIRNAYRLTGSNNFYDGMITCSTVSGKAVCRLVWDMGKEECGEYLNKAFTGVPEDFAGKLLEAPVGTGILTMPLYQTLPRADITCLDYSPDMMGQAREKAERMGLQNVQFRQGDVGALALGGCLGTMAVITRQELVLAVMGGIFVVETLSVMIQTVYFRLSHGKRIFLMAPVHHHFELKGWKETQVVTRFWIITMILVLIGLSTLKIR